MSFPYFLNGGCMKLNLVHTKVNRKNRLDIWEHTDV